MWAGGSGARRMFRFKVERVDGADPAGTSSGGGEVLQINVVAGNDKFSTQGRLAKGTVLELVCSKEAVRSESRLFGMVSVLVKGKAELQGPLDLTSVLSEKQPLHVDLQNKSASKMASLRLIAEWLDQAPKGAVSSKVKLGRLASEGSVSSSTLTSTTSSSSSSSTSSSSSSSSSYSSSDSDDSGGQESPSVPARSGGSPNSSSTSTTDSFRSNGRTDDTCPTSKGSSAESGMTDTTCSSSSYSSETTQTTISSDTSSARTSDTESLRSLVDRLCVSDDHESKMMTPDLSEIKETNEEEKVAATSRENFVIPDLDVDQLAREAYDGVETDNSSQENEDDSQAEVYETDNSSEEEHDDKDEGPHVQEKESKGAVVEEECYTDNSSEKEHDDEDPGIYSTDNSSEAGADDNEPEQRRPGPPPHRQPFIFASPKLQSPTQTPKAKRKSPRKKPEHDDHDEDDEYKYEQEEFEEDKNVENMKRMNQTYRPKPSSSSGVKESWNKLYTNDWYVEPKAQRPKTSEKRKACGTASKQTRPKTPARRPATATPVAKAKTPKRKSQFDSSRQNFLDRMDTLVERKTSRKERVELEKDYESSRKKKCPKCGCIQSFDQVQKRQKKCGDCGVLFRYPVVWDQVRSSFMQRNDPCASGPSLAGGVAASIGVENIQEKETKELEELLEKQIPLPARPKCRVKNEKFLERMEQATERRKNRNKLAFKKEAARKKAAAKKSSFKPWNSGGEDRMNYTLYHSGKASVVPIDSEQVMQKGVSMAPVSDTTYGESTDDAEYWNARKVVSQHLFQQ